LGHELRVEVSLDRLRPALAPVAAVLHAAEGHFGRARPRWLMVIIPLSTLAATAFAVLAERVKA
jgi:hypothetical protein